jgi:hypothetical protein
VSCAAAFDWRALVAHRLDARLAEPAGWPDAVAHLGACAECRRAALAADPTLVFLRLGEERAGAREPAQELAEVERVRGAVAAMRAASRLGRGRRPSRAGWKRWAAAAVLLPAALSTGRRAELPAGVMTAGITAGMTAVEEPPFPAPAARLPMIELDRPEARVHVGVGPGISNIMVYDENFEGLDV